MPTLRHQTHFPEGQWGLAMCHRPTVWVTPALQSSADQPCLWLQCPHQCAQEMPPKPGSLGRGTCRSKGRAVLCGGPWCPKNLGWTLGLGGHNLGGSTGPGGPPEPIAQPGFPVAHSPALDCHPDGGPHCQYPMEPSRLVSLSSCQPPVPGLTFSLTAGPRPLLYLLPAAAPFNSGAPSVSSGQLFFPEDDRTRQGCPVQGSRRRPPLNSHTEPKCRPERCLEATGDRAKAARPAAASIEASP